jgi:hypothetical protein
MTIFQLSILVSFLVSKIFALQFGFTVKDDKNSLNGRFLAFGIIPDNTSSKIQAEVIDQLTAFINEELYKRILEGVDRTSFLVPNSVVLSELKDGKVLLGLKGESSIFLNLFRMSCKYVIRTRNIWKDVTFFPDPIIILNLDEIDMYMKEFEIIMLSPAIAEDDESIYSEITYENEGASFTSQDYDDDDDDDDDERKSSCFNNCIIT